MSAENVCEHCGVINGHDFERCRDALAGKLREAERDRDGAREALGVETANANALAHAAPGAEKRAEDATEDANLFRMKYNEALASADAWKAKCERAEAECGSLRGAADEMHALSGAIHQIRTRFKLNQHAQEWADFIEERVNVAAGFRPNDAEDLRALKRGEEGRRMSTVTIQIGNSDDKLTQVEWANFVTEVRDAMHALQSGALWLHFFGASPNYEKWQNACWVITTLPADKTLDALREKLCEICGRYRQDSIAWTEGETTFLRPALKRGEP